MVWQAAEVVALDGDRVPVTLAVIHRVSAHGGGELGVCEDLGRNDVESVWKILP